MRADTTVDVIVRANCQDVDVDAPLALLAGQAVLVIRTTLDDYFLSLENFNVTVKNVLDQNAKVHMSKTTKKDIITKR